MKTRINLKAILILLAVVAALGAGDYFLHGYQMKRNARAVLEQAEEAEREGDVALQAQYLRMYLGLVPNDADALGCFGMLLSKETAAGGAHLQAYDLLEKALRGDRSGSHDDWRRVLVRLALEANRANAARDHLKVCKIRTPRTPR
jgi:hypothetical protein